MDLERNQRQSATRENSSTVTIVRPSIRRQVPAGEPSSLWISSVTPATTRHRRLGAKLIAAIGRIHIALPEPRPHYPWREPNYFEGARMSREMDRL
jgi:hypothetical protein